MNDFQRDFPFGMAKKHVTLGLVQSNPVDEFQYEYRYPADCQYIDRIRTSYTPDNRQTVVDFEIRRDTTGRVIWTNQVDAILDYQVIETDSSRYQVDFVLAFSYRLAELIAPRITKGDPFKLGPQAAANYDKAKRKAQAASLNEQQEPEPAQSEFVRAQFEETLYPLGAEWTAHPDNKDIF